MFQSVGDSHLEKQSALLRTALTDTRVPPQTWLPFFWRPAIHGHMPAAAEFPSKMRRLSGAFPQKTCWLAVGAGLTVIVKQVNERGSEPAHRAGTHWWGLLGSQLQADRSRRCRGLHRSRWRWRWGSLAGCWRCSGWSRTDTGTRGRTRLESWPERSLARNWPPPPGSSGCSAS